MSGRSGRPTCRTRIQILILDFGAQYTQLIARRAARDAASTARSIRTTSTTRSCARSRRRGIILSGGPSSVTEGDTPRAPARRVGRSACRCSASATACRRWPRSSAARVEAGTRARVRLRRGARARPLGAASTASRIARNAEGHGMLDVWMSHGDKVDRAAAGLQARSASSDACAIAAMADETRRFYAVQFHPEVTHTKQGAAILARFAHDICGCGDDWNMPDYVGEAIARDPRAGRQRRSAARAVGRRRFVGRRRAASTGRSASSSPACSSTTACCA